MTDPPKPKRKVTGQITLASPLTTSNPSTPSTSHLPRARAKVDVSNLPSPATNTRPTLAQSYSSTGSAAGGGGRPTLRNTPSSASLRSTTSTGSRTKSPAPPLPSPSLQSAGRGTTTPNTTRPTFRPSTSQTSTPVFRRAASSGRTSPVKETPTARIRASAVTQNAFSGRSPQVNGGGSKAGEADSPYTTPSGQGQGQGQGFFKKPNDVEQPKLRARVTPNHTTISTSPEKYPPLLSPDTALDQSTWRTGQSQTYPSPLLPNLDIYGNTKPSSTNVVSPTFAQHAIMSQIPMHPTASAPGSPHHPANPLSLQRSVSIKSTARRMLPYNPTNQAPNIPSTPLSPEMRTVDLPMMTPTRTRSREDPVRRPSLLGSGTGRVDDGALLSFDEPEQTSEETFVGSAGAGDKSVEGEPQDISEIDILLDTEDDVMEARVNRKIADLEITNASLLAINRSLEATKSKQRSEILKLRRMLRESIQGPLPGLPVPLPSYLTSPNPDEEEESDEEDMRDPELDARWDRVAEMVENMNKKAVVAVEKGKEEIKVAGRVLDWTEVEGLNSSVGSMAGTPEPERVTT